MFRYRRLFSYFCTISYLTENYRFTIARALETLSKSITASQIVVDKEKMLEDLEQCTCMLIKDGLEFAFSHRSFQEYFVAHFFSNVKPKEFEKFSSKLAVRGDVDDVLLMISAMSADVFEETWALPRFQKICEELSGIDFHKNIIGFIKVIYFQDQLELIIIPRDNQLFIRVLLDEERSVALIEQECLFRIYNLEMDDGPDDKELLQEIRKGM
jgi:hypothetical protein